MIFLTFIGNHDKIEAGQPYGAALTIFLRYKDVISRVYLFVTPSKIDNQVNYTKIGLGIKSVMELEKPGVNVSLIAIDLPNPVDYDLVYPKMLDETQKIFEDETICEAEKIINITSGTPTMTACWIVLHKSGLIPNSKIVQAFESKYARERGKSVQEVNLEFDDFPQITAPSMLKRQLTILKREKEKLSEKIRNVELSEKIPELVGHSEVIQNIKDQIIYDIDRTTHILITGERGTGKEVVAQAIWRIHHKKEDRQLKTFDCGTFAKDLINAELFGYIRGSFTGANETRNGILSENNGRMLFLDEIGNLPMTGQNALLRYLSTGEVRKIGSQQVEHVSTQIIAATNKNINDSTLFAQDVKDRFDEIITLPSLCSRKEDIPLLIKHFITRYSLNPLILSHDIINTLIDFDWPGNVRELEKWIKRIIRRFPDGGELSLEDLPGNVIQQVLAEDDLNDDLPNLPLSFPFDRYIEKIIEKARMMSSGKMADVDRLLNQKLGTEKQRQYRLRKS